MKKIKFQCETKLEADNTQNIVSSQLNGPDTNQGNITIYQEPATEKPFLINVVIEYISEIPTSDIADCLIYAN